MAAMTSTVNSCCTCPAWLPNALVYAPDAARLLLSHVCPQASSQLPSLCRWACHWATYCMGWNVIHQFMLTGKFEWSVPLLGRVLTYQNPGGRPGCDWWGIQYYSR